MVPADIFTTQSPKKRPPPYMIFDKHFSKRKANVSEVSQSSDTAAPTDVDALSIHNDDDGECLENGAFTDEIPSLLDFP